MGRKNLNDTEAGILYQRKLPEQRRAPSMKLRDNPGSEQARRNPVRARSTLRVTPKIDHRFDEIPQAVVDEDPARRAFFFFLMFERASLRITKQELMRDLFPEDEKSFAPMSDQAINKATSKLSNA